MDRNIDVGELHKLPDAALLDTFEAAAFLGLTHNTLNSYRTKAIDSQRCPPFIKGQMGTIRYPLGGLRTWIGLPLKGEG